MMRLLVGWTCFLWLLPSASGQQPMSHLDEWDVTRREVRQLLRDYGRVKNRMVHRFVHDDGSGYSWTNDLDDTKVVWLL